MKEHNRDREDNRGRFMSTSKNPLLVRLPLLIVAGLEAAERSKSISLLRIKKSRLSSTAQETAVE